MSVIETSPVSQLAPSNRSSGANVRESGASGMTHMLTI